MGGDGSLRDHECQSVQEISEALGESVEHVEQILELIKKYPERSDEQIAGELKGTKAVET